MTTIEVSVIGLPMRDLPHSGQSVAQETDRRLRVDLRAGTTVDDLIRRLGLAEEEIQGVLVNGRHASRDTVLENGDAVAFTGQVSGD